MKTSSPTDRSLEHPIIWVAVIGGALGSILLLKAVAWLAFPLILAVVLYYLGTAASPEIAVSGGYTRASIGNLFRGCDRPNCDFFHSCPAQDVELFV